MVARPSLCQILFLRREAREKLTEGAKERKLRIVHNVNATSKGRNQKMYGLGEIVSIVIPIASIIITKILQIFAKKYWLGVSSAAIHAFGM